MSAGDLCDVFSSFGEAAAEMIECLEKLKEALAASIEESAERLEKIKEALLEAWDAEEIRDFLREERLDWLDWLFVTNEKKKRRIKRKDRVLRWFVMVAHPEPRRMARKRAETARRATKARFPINYPQTVENLVETSERAFFALFLIFLNFGKIFMKSYCKIEIR